VNADTLLSEALTLARDLLQHRGTKDHEDAEDLSRLLLALEESVREGVLPREWATTR